MASEVAAATTTTAAAAPAARAAAAGFKSSSLWVGDLNPSVSETDLFDIFNAVAPVASIRVCRNVATRESLGYAYVNFQTPADAEKAMSELNFSNIKDRACRIMWSQRDPSMRRSNVGNVFVKNLAPIVDARQLNDTFKLFGTILSCKVATDPKGESKGYGFVHFETDDSARAAIDAVNNMDFAGRVVQVMHYLPRQMRSGPEWTNVYAKNLPKNIMVKELNEMFGAFGDVVSAFVAQDETGSSRGFGFVSFKTHAAAQAAVEALNGKELEGAPATMPPARKVKKEKKEGEVETEAEKEAEVAAAPTSCKLYVGRAQKKSERERTIRENMEVAKREKAAKWANCNLYVRNLDETVDDELLKKEFQPHGTITSARIERDSEGRSRLFGYVCYSSSEEAAKALQAMQRKLVAGKPLFVTLWQPREQRIALLAQQRPAGARAGNAAGANASAANMMAMMQQASTNPAVFQTMMLYVLMAQQAAARGQSPNNQVQQQLSQALMMNPAAVAIYQQLQNQQMVASRVAGGARAGVPAQAAGMPGAAQAPNANFVATMAAMAQLSGAAGFPGQQRGPRGPRGQQSTSVVGGARVAAGPAAGQNAGAPRTGPTAAAVAAGARPAPRASVAPNGQAAGRAGANAGPVYRTGVVRNDGAAPAPYDAMAAMNGTQTAAASAAPVETAQNFATQLAAAQPAMRRQMLGERLYSQIAAKESVRAGKITGMLLDGMDEGELLHLLEAPEELSDRINEALGVLHQHELASESK